MTYEFRLKQYLQDVQDVMRLSCARNESTRVAFESENAGRSFESLVFRARFIYSAYDLAGDFNVKIRGAAIVEIALDMNPNDFRPAKAIGEALLADFRAQNLTLGYSNSVQSWAPKGGLLEREYAAANPDIT